MNSMKESPYPPGYHPNAVHVLDAALAALVATYLPFLIGCAVWGVCGLLWAPMFDPVTLLIWFVAPGWPIVLVDDALFPIVAPMLTLGIVVMGTWCGCTSWRGLAITSLLLLIGNSISATALVCWLFLIID